MTDTKQKVTYIEGDRWLPLIQIYQEDYVNCVDLCTVEHLKLLENLWMRDIIRYSVCAVD